MRAHRIPRIIRVYMYICVYTHTYVYIYIHMPLVAAPRPCVQYSFYRCLRSTANRCYSPSRSPPLSPFSSVNFSLFLSSSGCLSSLSCFSFPLILSSSRSPFYLSLSLSFFLTRYSLLTIHCHYSVCYSLAHSHTYTHTHTIHSLTLFTLLTVSPSLQFSRRPRRDARVYAARGACARAHRYAPVDRTEIEREVLDGSRAQ